MRGSICELVNIYKHLNEYLLNSCFSPEIVNIFNSLLCFTKSDSCRLSLRPLEMSSLSERFSKLRQELKELQTKSIQFEMDFQQYEKVLATISDFPDDRTTYRLVGEVLVQMPVKEAKVVLEAQKNSLKELCATFKEKVQAKEEELIKFQKDNNIQIRPLSEIQNAK